ncbi:hypothetical protein [Fictibacillus phosphorivorans]|uniref:Uncharacterized protein n=1 Tax=Fictibacillus phosphorivorans TaxID=1221500 RepID=A0A160IKY9_9BACL|nr:hypothetical protein [Fictibacillus phosphorivorans]ANC76888.1 hypothetical protein ABE65_008765 [Fictibacillus phosphorivorans]MQR96496.1 hypothetical protein [Fictibacillus phosphorivorans]
MSLKLIELQVAIPRTLDASKESVDLMNRGLLQQQHTSEEIRKKDKKEAERVNQKEATESGLFQTNDQHQQEKTSSKSSNHPYKGSKIDYSG